MAEFLQLSQTWLNVEQLAYVEEQGDHGTGKSLYVVVGNTSLRLTGADAESLKAFLDESQAKC